MKRIIALTILFLSASCVYAQHCPSGTVPIQGGGTCATTAAGALANLGGASVNLWRGPLNFQSIATKIFELEGWYLMICISKRC